MQALQHLDDAAYRLVGAFAFLTRETFRKKIPRQIIIHAVVANRPLPHAIPKPRRKCFASFRTIYLHKCPFSQLISSVQKIVPQPLRKGHGVQACAAYAIFP